MLLPLASFVCSDHVVKPESSEFRRLEGASCRVIDEGRPVYPAFTRPVQMDVDIESSEHVPEVPLRSRMLETGGGYPAYPAPLTLLKTALPHAFHCPAFIFGVQCLPQLLLSNGCGTGDAVLVQSADDHL